MNQSYINVSDIKAMSKNLRIAVEEMNINLTHSSALNLSSRALGYKNYNTYKALNTDNVGEEKKEFSFKPFSEVIAEYDKEIEEKYPSIDKNFVKFSETEEYEVFIDRELSSDDYYYYLIYRLKKPECITKRVFFVPEYDHISFYIYPNVKAATNDYYLPIETNDPQYIYGEYFNLIYKASTKYWFNNDFLRDSMHLMYALRDSKKEISDLSKQFTSDNLEEFYKSKST